MLLLLGKLRRAAFQVRLDDPHAIELLGRAGLGLLHRQLEVSVGVRVDMREQDVAVGRLDLANDEVRQGPEPVLPVALGPHENAAIVDATMVMHDRDRRAPGADDPRALVRIRFD